MSKATICSGNINSDAPRFLFWDEGGVLLYLWHVLTLMKCSHAMPYVTNSSLVDSITKQVLDAFQLSLDFIHDILGYLSQY